jgi:hypothetical protein
MISNGTADDEMLGSSAMAMFRGDEIDVDEVVAVETVDVVGLELDADELVVVCVLVTEVTGGWTIRTPVPQLGRLLESPV